MSAPWRILPDFLLIGAQKSGTTDLDRRISRCPRILPRTTKECRVLVGPRPSQLACRAFQETRGRRRHAEREHGGSTRAGDACPYYLFHPRAPKVARDLLGPDLDLIVLLRDPALRAWSHHRHAVRHGFEPLDFAAAIDAEPDRLAGEETRLTTDPTAVSGPHQHWSYIARGRYATQLERWFDAFPRDRFLIVFSEAFFSDPADVLRRVEDHLGLPATPEPSIGDIANRGDGSRPDDATLHGLRDRFAEDDRRLATLLGGPLPWRTDVATGK